MVLGIGADLLDARRVYRGLDAVGEAYIQRVFSPAEQACAGTRPDPRRYYACAFCAKEAVFKALGLAGGGLDLREIELTYWETGAPQIRLTGALGRYAEERNLGPVLISLSGEGRMIQACALVQERERERAPEREQPAPAPPGM